MAQKLKIGGRYFTKSTGKGSTVTNIRGNNVHYTGTLTGWTSIARFKELFHVAEPEPKTVPKKTLKVSTVPPTKPIIGGRVSTNLSSFARLNPNIPRETQTNEDSLTPVFNTETSKKLSKSPNIALIGIGIIVLYFILKK